jgi:hypothetical protein
LRAHHAVQPLGHAEAEALQRSRQRGGVGRLDDEVDVVVLDGEVADAATEPATAAVERTLEDREAPPGAEVPECSRMRNPR